MGDNGVILAGSVGLGLVRVRAEEALRLRLYGFSLTVEFCSADRYI